MLMPSKVFSQNSEVRLPRNIPREDRAGGRRGGNGSSGLVGSKLDLITFLEQLNDPRSIRRMESTAVFPGMYEWMEMMTQIRGPRSSEEVILCQVVLEDHLWWK